MNEQTIKILLLEDRKTEAEFTKRAVLKYFPNAVFNVATGKESFLEKIERGPYDAVLGDYHLPDYNGLEALLYARKNYPALPFVFVTGTLNSEEKAAQAILHGANGYVLKDNVRSIGPILEEILKVAANEAKEAAAKQLERNELKIKLQRAGAILTQAPEFTEKDFVGGLLAQLSKSL